MPVHCWSELIPGQTSIQEIPNLLELRIVYIYMSIAQPQVMELDNIIYITKQPEAPITEEEQNTLMQETYTVAYRVAYKLMGHKESAEDVAVEAVSRLIEKKISEESFAPSYGARIAANLVISSWRKDAVAKKICTYVGDWFNVII